MDEAALAELRALLAAGGGEEDDIWPDNAEIVAAFVSIGSQWRVASIGGGRQPMRLVWLGLDYAGARAGIEAAGFALTPDLWEGVRVMEAAARDALNGIRG